MTISHLPDMNARCADLLDDLLAYGTPSLTLLPGPNFDPQLPMFVCTVVLHFYGGGYVSCSFTTTQAYPLPTVRAFTELLQQLRIYRVAR